MWIFTTQDFYSVVQHTEQPEKVIVRCRTAADLEALRAQIPSLEPFEDPTADYRHRAIVDRDEWTRALASLGAELDYRNVKNEVAERQGHDRAKAYAAVWSILHRLQGR